MRRTLFFCYILFSLLLSDFHLRAQNVQLPTERIVFDQHDSKQCLKCHGMINFAFRDSVTSKVRDLTVRGDTFVNSIHGKLQCQQCHTDIKEYPHTFSPVRKKILCGDDCHATDKEGKKYSHTLIFNEFRNSVHKKGLTDPNTDNPTCVTCHGGQNAHAIQKSLKAISVQAKMDLCVSCHVNKALMEKNKVDPEAVSSYRKSFHFKAIRFGETNTAVCQDCHSVHNILPKDSVRSSIASANISKTCGQDKCHAGAKMNFSMSGANHLGLRIQHEAILWYEEKLFIVLTLGTMLMLVIGIILDIQRKFGWIHLIQNLIQYIKGKSVSMNNGFSIIFRIMKRILID